MMEEGEVQKSEVRHQELGRNVGCWVRAEF